MSISSIVSRGFGNGTFDGAIASVTLRGYSIGTIPTPTPKGGGGRSRRRKRTWKTTREILAEMREEREEQLEAIVNEPVSQWPEPVEDDWLKRKMVVGLLLDKRKKRKDKMRRMAAALLLLDD